MSFYQNRGSTGFFPDVSVSELRGMFSNEDERSLGCGCEITDPIDYNDCCYPGVSTTNPDPPQTNNCCNDC